MTITLPLELVQEMAQEAGIGIDEDDYSGDETGHVYLRYSGRGMYGRECLGVVGGLSDLIKFVIAVYDDWRSYPENWPKGFIPGQLDSPVTDSMGRESIYYWPAIRVGEEEA